MQVWDCIFSAPNLFGTMNPDGPEGTAKAKKELEDLAHREARPKRPAHEVLKVKAAASREEVRAAESACAHDYDSAGGYSNHHFWLHFRDL